MLHQSAVIKVLNGNTINMLSVLLKNDQSKRFVWEEVSFLSVWWKQSSEEQHKLMNKLAQSKQLEFIGKSMYALTVEGIPAVLVSDRLAVVC